MDARSDQQLIFYRRLLAIGGVAYLLWWVSVEVFLPGAYNPLGSRLVVVALMGVVSWAARFPAVARRIALWASFVLWTATLHYFYLFHRNRADINWVIGAYITVVAVAHLLHSAKGMLAYAVFVLLLSVVIVRVDTNLAQTIFLPGMVTILVFSYFGLRARLELAERESVRALERVQFEASREGVRVRDEFISIVAHELKTPLTNLRLQTQVAQRALLKGDGTLEPARLRRLLDQTDRHAAILEKLTAVMFDIARISDRKFAIEREDGDLVPFVHSVIESYTERAEIGGQRIESSFAAPQIPLRFDRFRMEQVISNLLSNAFKYGGESVIRVNVRPAEAGQPPGAWIEVSDHGVGISKLDQSRIFDKFERAVSATRISGLGLGLYICRQIIEAHGGRIEVESEISKGSKFKVFLPKG